MTSEDKPAEILPGFDEPNDETMSEDVRRKLAPPPDEDEIPPAVDE